MNEFEASTTQQEQTAQEETQGVLDMVLAQPEAVYTSYETARPVGKARNVNAVVKQLLEEAALAGEEFYYGWGAGKDKVEGPSQELAHSAARCWGNCAVEALPIQSEPDSWVFPARFIDLETGFTLTRMFRQSKRWQVYGKLDSERKDDVRFQIGQSKAARNVILKALPNWIITQALERAKQGVRRAIDKLIEAHGIAKAAEMAVSALVKAGVKQEAVFAKFGVAAAQGLTADHLVIMKGDLSAIQNGRDWAESLYPPVQENGKTASTGSRTADLSAKIKAHVAESAPPVDAPV